LCLDVAFTSHVILLDAMTEAVPFVAFRGRRLPPIPLPQ
jgi:hypothetical protein